MYLCTIGAQFLEEQANVVVDNMHHMEPDTVRNDYEPLIIHCLKVKHITDDDETTPNQQDMGSQINENGANIDIVQDKVTKLQKHMDIEAEKNAILLQKMDEMSKLLSK